MLLFFWCSLLIAPIARLGGGRAERVYKKSSSSSADTRSTFGDLKMKNQKEEKNDIKRVFQSRTRNNDDRSTTSQQRRSLKLKLKSSNWRNVMARLSLSNLQRFLMLFSHFYISYRYFFFFFFWVLCVPLCLVCDFLALLLTRISFHLYYFCSLDL